MYKCFLYKRIFDSSASLHGLKLFVYNWMFNSFILTQPGHYMSTLKPSTPGLCEYLL